MYKVFLHIVFFFCLLQGNAQTNLIYNGDFELYDTCPLGESMPSQYPNYEIEKCLGWTAPTIGTSDYQNTCSLGLCSSVPVNCGGEQLPYSGNGYCGGFFYSTMGGTGPNCGSCITWWEYIQGQFIQPLEEGRVYRISIYLSLGEVSEFALGQLGIYISNDSIRNMSTTQPLNVTPQIESPSGYYFADTLNWMEFSGYYLADGGEQYLTIGNFKDSITSDTLRMKQWDPPFPASYYYVDGASTIDVTDEFLMPNIFTPNDDGINDYWEYNLQLSDTKLIIFDRWGNEINRLNEYPFIWNGENFQGSKCSDGVYYYVVNTKGKTLSEKLKRGFIQLVR